MRISCNWLMRHVDLEDVDLVALGRRFTMAVAELDGIEQIGAGLDDVVVGEVLSVRALPGKKVRLTEVDCGAHGMKTIVCGAPNVAEGQYVAVALPGQRLGALEVKVAEVAGVVSEGMICSEKELGFSDDHSGIMTFDERRSAGTPVTMAHPILRDTIWVLDNKSLTHRPDCWGHRGIAREVAALLGRVLRPLQEEIDFASEEPLKIDVREPLACPRYTATTMAGVTIAPSPRWLRMLLQRVGVRPINNVVDATNFAMLDVGNPLHAFDRRQIAGATIVVRAADDGERFTTLDGQERQLGSHDLVIADAERSIALAGVMGGLDSEIKDDTREIVLEAACFDPARVRMTAQRLGLRSESSARFEKSLDPRLAADAARVFIGLVLDLCPDARVTSAFMDEAAPYPEPTLIEIDVAYVDQRLGFAVGKERIVAILRGLAFEVEDVLGSDGQRLRVTVPSWRATKDIGIAEDLVEEVGRVFGYDNIPPAAPLVPVAQPDRNAKKKFERVVREVLASNAGLDELQTYSFDDDAFLARIGVVPGARVRLKNPITSDEPCLRTAIAPHLLKALDKNARGFERIGVFELGRVFTQGTGELPDQPTTLGALIAAVATPAAGWFAQGKALLQTLAGACERALPAVVQGGVEHPYAHPVRQARLVLARGQVGFLAELHPLVLHKLGVKHTGFVLELDLDALRASAPAPIAYRALPRFPAVYRDFAVIVPSTMPAGDVGAAIAGAAPQVSGVSFLSVYRGAGVADGEKSLAWSVTLRDPERTLTDAEARALETRIWAAVAAVGGRPRA